MKVVQRIFHLLSFSEIKFLCLGLLEKYRIQFINRFTPDVIFWQSWITFHIENHGYKNMKEVIWNS